MNIKIRRLTPDDADEYVRFFDRTPHDDGIDAHKCYCVCWASGDWTEEGFSTREKRREAAHRYVREGHLQGYLAYQGETLVGWCNANTKASCLRCCSWQRFMGAVPTEAPDAPTRVKAIFCFVIAPELQRQGIARQLLARVCADAQQEGFDCVEAYPSKVFASAAADFMGPAAMYEQSGFALYAQTEERFVMRKQFT